MRILKWVENSIVIRNGKNFERTPFLMTMRIVNRKIAEFEIDVHVI